jgi:hypothetical protein
MSYNEYTALLAEADSQIKSIDLEEAREMAQKVGLSIDSELPSLVQYRRDGTGAPVLTNGHSNTDHVVVVTGDYATDRIAELRRNLLTRCRMEQPESRRDDRWDKPRVPGERRRRIIREKDLPRAPPEPPPSGYIVFLGQMTTKLRYERRHERHSQTKVILEISKMWSMALTEEERTYYNSFCEELRNEYKRQHMEFRATGYYTPSNKFERLDGAGLWVRKNAHEKNALEREIATYDTVVFPMRPPEFDEEYRRREQESKEKRKAKLRSMAKGRKRKAPVESSIDQESPSES